MNESSPSETQIKNEQPVENNVDNNNTQNNEPVNKKEIVKKPLNLKTFLIVGSAVLLLGAFSIVKEIQSKNLTKTIANQNKKNLITNIEKNNNTLQNAQQNSQDQTTESKTPSYEYYKTNQGFSSITNKDDFSFSDDAAKILEQNNFVVVPSYGQEFFSVYESNRYGYTPNFITTDSILHTYHIVFNYILKKLELDQLASVLKTLNKSMLAESVSQYNSLKGTEWENAAKRATGFFAVGAKLLESNTQVPAFVSTQVNAELDLINKHEGIKESPIMNLGADTSVKISTPQGNLSPDALNEDYTQYIPRGHYDQNDQLRAYFKSMMWYGRLTFRFKSEDEIKSAMLISLALNKKANFDNWNKIFETINFFVGSTDDVTYTEFYKLMSLVYGGNISIDTLKNNKTAFTTFVEKTKELAPPQINSMVIFNPAIQPDRNKEITGFRYMGQRFTIDASIMQKLVYRDVGENSEKTLRYLPKGLDIPAAMGSKEALNILTSLGETDYKDYSQNMKKSQDYLASLNKDTWTQNLYWSWMYALKTLTDDVSDKVPAFMKNRAWVRKQLNTYLGSWTELKHDTILYAKQVYAEMGGGPPEVKDDKGYVEPNPELYARLSALIQLTKSGLNEKGFLNKAIDEDLTKMLGLTTSLKTIADKELTGKPLSDAEYELIRNYGGDLEHLWYEVNKEDMGDLNSMTYLDQNPSMLVADVATNPNGQVLEEATGKVNQIYVIINIDGKPRIATGTVYSYYEFPWPINDRLTDTKWRELLNSENAPKVPSWTKDFLAEQ